MKHQETVIIIDFGGQYAQLIARRVRECGVYCEILPYNKPAEEILSHNPKGIIFSGGPASVNMENAEKFITRKCVDGLYVGRSAWDARQFDKLIRMAKAASDEQYK